MCTINQTKYVSDKPIFAWKVVTPNKNNTASSPYLPFTWKKGKNMSVNPSNHRNPLDYMTHRKQDYSLFRRLPNGSSLESLSHYLTFTFHCFKSLKDARTCIKIRGDLGFVENAIIKVELKGITTKGIVNGMGYVLDGSPALCGTIAIWDGKLRK